MLYIPYGEPILVKNSGHKYENTVPNLFLAENQVLGWRDWFSWLRLELECLKMASVGEKLEIEAESTQIQPNPPKSAQTCFGEICLKRCAARFDAEPCRHCAEIFFLKPILEKTDFSAMCPNSCCLAKQQMCCLARQRICCLAQQLAAT